MRKLEELVDKDSSWGVLQDLMKNATNHYELLPKNQKKAEETLVDLQQSTKSLMGALVYETGGIFIDHGWIRILGSGSEKMKRSMTDWNKGRVYDEHGEEAGYLMVADDIFGGIFAVNGNDLGDDTGNIYYLAPDGLEWHPLSINLHELLEFFFTGDLSNLYEDLKWEGWEKEVATVTGDQAISVYPFLFTEGGPLDERERSVVNMDEHYEWMLDMSRQIEEFYEANGMEEDDEDCCGEEGCGCNDDDSDCCGEEGCGCNDDDSDCCGEDDCDCNDEKDDGCCGESGCGCKH